MLALKIPHVKNFTEMNSNPALRDIYFHLKNLGVLEKRLLYRLEPDSILIATQERTVAMLAMELDSLELSFDHTCPFNAKVSIVNIIKKAAPHEKLVIGPDVTIVQLGLDIKPEV